MPRVLRNADCRRGLEAPADVLADPVRGVGVEAKSLAPVPALDTLDEPTVSVLDQVHNPVTG